MPRTGQSARRTRETDVRCGLSIDGSGKTKISTGIGFADHMLELLGRHALIDLEIQATGDLQVDAHHTVEDVGIVLGQALAQALGDRAGLRRYGFASIPMDEALVQASIDLSGRGRCELAGEFPKGAPLDPSLVEGFLVALSGHSGTTLHLEACRGRDAHHVIEAAFKAIGRALRQAVEVDPRESGVPSTKGVL